MPGGAHPFALLAQRRPNGETRTVRPTRRRHLAAFCAAALASGCATAAKQKLQVLPMAEQQAFWRCEPYAWARYQQQNAGEEGVYRPEFVTSTAEYYVKLPGETARRQFLLESGCPPDEVAKVPAAE